MGMLTSLVAVAIFSPLSIASIAKFNASLLQLPLARLVSCCLLLGSLEDATDRESTVYEFNYTPNTILF